MNRNELMILIEYIYYIFGITTYKCYIHNLQVTAMFDIVVKRRAQDTDRNTCNPMNTGISVNKMEPENPIENS